MNKKGKPGWKSTEFQLVAVTNLITTVQALTGVIPPEYAIVVLAVLNGVYAALRSYVKAKEAQS